MRTYLSLHPGQDRSYSPEELDMLDAPAVRVVDILGITDDVDRNEAAAQTSACSFGRICSSWTWCLVSALGHSQQMTECFQAEWRAYHD